MSRWSLSWSRRSWTRTKTPDTDQTDQEGDAGQPLLATEDFEISFEARQHRGYWGDTGSCSMRLAFHEVDTKATLMDSGPTIDIDDEVAVARWSALDGDMGWTLGEHLEGPESVWLHGDTMSFELVAVETDGGVLYEYVGCKDFPHEQHLDLEVPAGGDVPAFDVEDAARIGAAVTLATPGPLMGGTYVHDVGADMVVDWHYDGAFNEGEQVVVLFTRSADEAAPSEALSWRADGVEGLVLEAADLQLLPHDEGREEQHNYATLEITSWTDSEPFTTPAGASARIRANTAMGGPVQLVRD